MPIIRGGYIIDGSGSAGFTGDVIVENGTIVGIAKGGVPNAAGEVVDAAGKIVCPGFIDMHRHCDLAVLRGGFGSLELRQGITTCIAGNCGMAPVPNRPETRKELGDYLLPCLGPFADENFSTHAEYAQRMQSGPLPLNMGFLAGMGALRIAVKGFGSSPYTKAEMEKAQSLLAEALDAGAFGLSVGLMYVPELYSCPDEIASLAKLVRGRGILVAHMRHETEGLVSAVEEVIGIAKKAEVPLEISHFKAAGAKAWHGLLHRAMELIERERAAGTDVGVDFYPYDCGSSTMMQMLPPSYLAGGIEKALAGLDNPKNIDKIRGLLERGEKGWDNLSKTIGWDRTLIAAVSLGENQKYLGKTIREAAAESGAGDEAAFVARLLFREKGKVGIINRSMSPEDIDSIARLPYSSLVSDALYGDMKTPHPRLTGAFPRFLRDFVVERGVVSMEEGIRKMTGAPAARMGFRDRGLLSPGMRADILVFDPNEFRDESSYAEPAREASGLALCLIAGVKVLEEGRVTGYDAGGFEKRPLGG